MLGKKKPESDNTPPVTNISKKLNVDGITLKKGDKRQSSSRMRLSENRELVKLPPLKDASVSTLVLTSLDPFCNQAPQFQRYKLYHL